MTAHSSPSGSERGGNADTEVRASLSDHAVLSEINKTALPKVTGWPAGLMQDDCRKLFKWFASKPDARMRVREMCAAILKEQA